MRSIHPALAGLPTDPASKAERLRRFVGPMAESDRQTVAFWRAQSPAAHAAAMIELAGYAERMAAQTGFGKNPDEMFPGFAPMPSRPPGDGPA